MTALRKVVWLGVLVSILINLLLAGFATVDIEIIKNDVKVTYPDKVIFRVEFESDVEITAAELSFGTDALSCAEAITRAFPEDFEPGVNGEAEWEWNFRRSGTIPPGTEVWWQWKLTNADGEEFLTERQTFVYWDDSKNWNRAEGDDVILYWLEGDAAFAQTLIDAGDDLARQLEKEVGVELSEKVTVLVYPDSNSMQDATLFLPSWSGGVAFSQYHKVLVGIGPDSLDWGRRVMRHEMTHVIIMQYTFSCVDSIPTWVNEGSAEYFEGDWQDHSKSRLQTAIDKDSIFSVVELGFAFSGDPELARLAYSQSHSLVEYLLDTYGQKKMLSLLDQFSAGMSEDKALESVYGLDRNSLEAEWRLWVGATPIEIGSVATETPTRTPVPTLAPIGAPVSSGATSTPAPTMMAVVSETVEPLPEPTEAQLVQQEDAVDPDENIPADDDAPGFFSQLCGSAAGVMFGVLALVVQRRKDEFN